MGKAEFPVKSEYVFAGLIVISLASTFVWVIPSTGTLEILATLILIGTLLIRWRLRRKADCMIIDNAALIAVVVIYPQLAYLLYLHILYFAYYEKYLFMLPPMIVSLYFLAPSLVWIPCVAALLGGIVGLWNRESLKLHDSCDELRMKVYRMEQFEANLLSDYKDTERISKLTERQRIAEILHDNLGHELTGAHLSVKAVGMLLGQQQIEQALRSQQKAELRLQQALHQLKDTVRVLEPESSHDIQAIRHMLDAFEYPVQFDYQGDMARVPPFGSQLIFMSLKEALTNIQKHAKPSFVSVGLLVTEAIVRLEVTNDGIQDTGEPNSSGGGLRYMRKRIEAVKGSLSIQKTNVFGIIITIPFTTGS